MNTEREAFEAYCSRGNINTDQMKSSAYPAGTYADSRTDAAWLAWQARASSAASTKDLSAERASEDDNTRRAQDAAWTQGGGYFLRFDGKEHLYACMPVPEWREWLEVCRRASSAAAVPAERPGLWGAFDAVQAAKPPAPAGFVAAQAVPATDAERAAGAGSRDKEDAERYRWLRDNGRYNDFSVEQQSRGWVHTHSAASLDAAIDAARGKA